MVQLLAPPKLTSLLAWPGLLSTICASHHLCHALANLPPPGGDNFGCGSSREHAPVALGASGTQVVVAETYARIFFRNSVAT